MKTVLVIDWRSDAGIIAHDGRTFHLFDLAQKVQVTYNMHPHSVSSYFEIRSQLLEERIQKDAFDL